MFKRITPILRIFDEDKARDFYLEYFKFSPQIKLTYGILNLLSEDETIYTKSVEKLTTNAWLLSFTFE